MVWYYTNESLEAISSGLPVGEHDLVLSVCGSSAVPFALLEQLNQGVLIAMDVELKQLLFAQKVGGLFEQRDVYGIVDLQLCPKNPDYFSARRVELIARNLARLHLVQGCLKSPLPVQMKFTRGYFSNIPLHLCRIEEIFQKNALIYRTLSFANAPVYEDCQICDSLFFQEPELSLQAQKLECRTQRIRHPTHPKGIFADWMPVVYRKR